MERVLVSGASGGLGKELARIFASKGNEVILVARNEKKLLDLKNEIEKNYNVKAYVFPKDLSTDNAVADLYNEIKEQGLSVTVLINNAGFGDYGRFVDSNIVKLKNMVDLNVRALMEATYLFGKDMKERKDGKILNIASIAAFLPGPYMAVYYATKAFVLSFSCAVNEEMKEYGVSVSALCPCPTKTGFEQAANLDDSNLFKSMKVERVGDMAQAGFKAVMKRKAVATYGAQSKVINFGTHFVTRSALAKMSKKFNGIPPKK